MEVEKYQLDNTDIQIVRELYKDGRISFRNIAEKLDIADGTVRSRVTRMMESGFLKISAMINPFHFENSILAHIGMELETRTHKVTMEKLARMNGVLSVCNTAGQYDLFIEVFLKSRDELNTFLFEKLPEINGIKSTHTFIYLDARDKWIEGKI
ncbi:MAG: Lrp/AsnC family transcriptional regulator [Spirochaetales bacterium]|nr:Lrp/AsnC family transcriptional regulator [Spirochaetales bacterium]